MKTVKIKHIGLIAKAIGLFPMIIIASYGYSKSYNLDLFWIQLAGIVAAGYLGYFQMHFKMILESVLNKRIVLIKLIMALSYMVSIVILILLSRYIPASDVIMRLTFFIMSLSLFIVFMRDYKLHYSCVLSLEMTVVITAIYTVALILCKFQVLGLLYIFIIGCYIFIGNQLKIEELLERTQKNTPLFSNIKRENAKWVCLVMSLIFIAYPFRNMILQAIEWITMKVIGIIFMVILFLISLLPITESSETPMEAVPGMGELPTSETNELLNFILWGLVTCLAIFLLYKYRNSIAAAIRERVIKMKELFSRIYHFLFDKLPQKKVEETCYEDHIEEISGIEASYLSQSESINRRKWRKAVKKYLKQAERDNSLREGYKLIMQGAKLLGTDIKGVYTPREIRVLIEENIGKLSLADETTAYEEVRYGEHKEKLEQLDQIRGTLDHFLNMGK